LKFNHSSIKSFGELLRYIRPWRNKVRFASICSILNKVFDIAPEVLIGVAVDLVVEKQNSFVASLGFSSIESQVIFLGVVTFVIWALESMFEYIYSIQWRGLAQVVEHEVRVSAYDHAQRLGLSWHENQSTGNITAILNESDYPSNRINCLYWLYIFLYIPNYSIYSCIASSDYFCS
jgi:ATP-binding cassette subfamily B protein